MIFLLFTGPKYKSYAQPDTKIFEICTAPILKYKNPLTHSMLLPFEGLSGPSGPVEGRVILSEVERIDRYFKERFFE